MIQYNILYICHTTNLHHVLLLGEVAIELEVLFGRSIFCAQGEDIVCLQLVLPQMSTEVFQEESSV